MAPMPERPWFQPSAALAAYAEPLVSGHAVIVFGDAGSGLGERLIERGARLVHVFDRDAARASEVSARNTSSRLSIAALGEGALALRDGVFDVALIEDLGAAGDAAGLLRSLRRALSPRGVALIASANPDVRLRLVASEHTNAESVAFDYYSLYDAVSAHFEHVRMLGQAPFVGYAVVDFAPEAELSPTIDTDFVSGGAEEPEWYIAFAAHRPHKLSEFTLVQLPFKSALAGGTARQLEDQLRAAQAAERRARARVADLENECRKLSRRERLVPGDTSQEAIYKSLEQRDNWIAQLEARAVTADTRADEAESELDAARERLTQLEAEVETARTEADRSRAELAAQADDRLSMLGELEATRDLLEQQRAATRQAEEAVAGRDARWQEQVQTTEDQASSDISAFEAQLLARAAEIQRLERELREAERIGRELISGLENASAAPLLDDAEPTAERPEALVTKLNTLAAQSAELEADLTAARWTIDQLVARVEELQEEGRGKQELEPADPALSRAKTLENELAQARASLEELTVLLEQAGRGAERDRGAREPSEPPAVSLTIPKERSLTE
jgi:SAM-dependent methyltransferase